MTLSLLKCCVSCLDCHACQYEKQSKIPFLVTTWRAKKKLQMIHTDVEGHLRTPSLRVVITTLFL